MYHWGSTKQSKSSIGSYWIPGSIVKGEKNQILLKIECTNFDFLFSSSMTKHKIYTCIFQSAPWINANIKCSQLKDSSTTFNNHVNARRNLSHFVCCTHPVSRDLGVPWVFKMSLLRPEYLSPESQCSGQAIEREKTNILISEILPSVVTYYQRVSCFCWTLIQHSSVFSPSSYEKLSGFDWVSWHRRNSALPSLSIEFRGTLGRTNIHECLLHN